MMGMSLGLKKVIMIAVFVCLVLFVSFVVVLAFVPGKDTEYAYSYVIGISQANQRDPWRLVLAKELREEASKHAELRLVFTDAADDVDKQKSDIHRLLACDVDLLIVSPCDAVALTQTVKEAYASIPVIVLDRVVDGFDYSLFIGPDNVLIGKQAGNAVLRIAHNSNVNVLEISASHASQMSQDRHAGFSEAISFAENISLTEVSVEDGTRDSAEDILMAMGTQLADVDIIFSHNDYLALGAYKAVSRLGYSNIKIVSIDGFQIPDGGMELLYRSAIDVDITCPTGGKEAIQYSLDILHKTNGVPKQVILRNYTVTRNSLAEYEQQISRLPVPLERKIVVGHAQIADEGGWRQANKASISSAAKEFGLDFQSIDADSLSSQIAIVRQFIQKDVDVIVLSPIVESGWEDILQECSDAEIPVFLSDRKVVVSNDNLYYSFIGGDFVEEGRRAMRWVVSAVQPTLKDIHIMEIQGTAGASPTKERRQGFLEVLSLMKGYEVVVSPYGDYNFEGGYKAVFDYFQEHKTWDIDVIYSHNDDMALGAVKALKEIGINPGKDVQIVSIDGTSAALKALRKGDLNCVVECSPLLGPQLMKAITDYMSGKDLPRRIITDEKVFTANTKYSLYAHRSY